MGASRLDPRVRDVCWNRRPAGRLWAKLAGPGLVGRDRRPGSSAECRKSFSWRGCGLLTEGKLPSGLHQRVGVHLNFPLEKWPSA